jgi:hypothetical protein
MVLANPPLSINQINVAIIIDGNGVGIDVTKKSVPRKGNVFLSVVFGHRPSAPNNQLSMYLVVLV